MHYGGSKMSSMKERIREDVREGDIVIIKHRSGIKKRIKEEVGFVTGLDSLNHLLLVYSCPTGVFDPHLRINYGDIVEYDVLIKERIITKAADKGFKIVEEGLRERGYL